MEMKSEDSGLGKPPNTKSVFRNATIEANLCLTNVTRDAMNQHKDGK